MQRWSFKYAILKFLIGFIHRLFYRKIIVTGKDNIPKGVPIILAPNHQNALMDPLAVIFTSGLQPVFLSRADIFKNPFIRFLLKSIKMLPVYRVRDGIGTVTRNLETFEGTTKILEARQSVALFPEAQHHGARFLLPIKKGVPRIAFLAEEANNFNLNIHVVPVGINFSNYFNFRSVLQVNYGEPIRVNTFKKDYLDSEVVGFNALREAISKGMRPLMIDIQDKVYYDTVDVLRKLFNDEVQTHLQLNAHHPNAYLAAEKAFISLFDALTKDRKEEYRDKTQHFVKCAKEHNVKAQVVAENAFTLRQLLSKRAKMLLLSPLFIIAYIIGVIPYSISNLMHGRSKDPQYESTFRFVLSLIALPLFYGVYAYFLSRYFQIGLSGIVLFYLFFHLGAYSLDFKKSWKKLNDQFRWVRISQNDKHPLKASRKDLFDLLKEDLRTQK